MDPFQDLVEVTVRVEFRGRVLSTRTAIAPTVDGPEFVDLVDLMIAQQREAILTELQANVQIERLT